MWREALGFSFTHLGIKSSEKGSGQVDSSMLHLGLQPRRAERSSLMAAALKEEAKVWGLDLGSGLCHGFCACNPMMQSLLMTTALLAHSDDLRLRCWYWQLDGIISTITTLEMMPAMK